MNNKFISWAIFVLLCFIWGSSFILMKVSSLGLTASQIAALRIFSAGLVFIPFAFFHFAKVSPKKTGLLLFYRHFSETCCRPFVLPSLLLKIDSSLAGILNSLTPICVVISGYSFFQRQDKISKNHWVYWPVLQDYAC